MRRGRLLLADRTDLHHHRDRHERKRSSQHNRNPDCRIGGAMNRRMRIFVNVLLLSLASAAMAQQKPANTLDVSATFSELRANAPVGGCGCFWMSGGTGEISYSYLKTYLQRLPSVASREIYPHLEVAKPSLNRIKH